MPSDTDGEKRKGLGDDNQAAPGSTSALAYARRRQEAAPIPSTPRLFQPSRAHSCQAAPGHGCRLASRFSLPFAERLCVLSTPPSPPVPQAFTAAHSSHRSARAALAPFPRKNSIRLKPGPLSSRVQPKRTCRTL